LRRACAGWARHARHHGETWRRMCQRPAPCTHTGRARCELTCVHRSAAQHCRQRQAAQHGRRGAPGVAEASMRAHRTEWPRGRTGGSPAWTASRSAAPGPGSASRSRLTAPEVQVGPQVAQSQSSAHCRALAILSSQGTGVGGLRTLAWKNARLRCRSCAATLVALTVIESGRGRTLTDRTKRNINCWPHEAPQRAGPAPASPVADTLAVSRSAAARRACACPPCDRGAVPPRRARSAPRHLTPP